MTSFSDTVLNWLIANRELFGVPAQNWMLVIGGGVLIYIAVLIVAERCRPRAH